jgi:ATP-dependent DNA ligase
MKNNLKNTVNFNPLYLLLKLLLFVVFYYCILTPLLKLFETSQEDREKERQETQGKSFEGIVLRKWHEPNHRNSNNIMLQMKNDSTTTISVTRYNDDVFIDVQVGDTISTKSGDTVVYVKREGASFTLNKLIPLDLAK